MAQLIGGKRLYLLIPAVLILFLAIFFWTASGQAQEPGADAGIAQNGSAEMGYNGPSGIWVNGQGTASGAPDMAVISLEVEVNASSAATARTEAAEAMTGVQRALMEAGIASSDIQTSHYNIAPHYRSVEVTHCPEDSSGEGASCWKSWESVITGYVASNQVTVKVRNLNNAGTVIDSVTEAASDSIRINGISFEISNRQKLADMALSNAVDDMKRKAGMLAQFSGVELGPLVYLTEHSASIPVQTPLYARDEMAAMYGAPTPISPGELEITASVQGVFLIGSALETQE